MFFNKHAIIFFVSTWLGLFVCADAAVRLDLAQHDLALMHTFMASTGMAKNESTLRELGRAMDQQHMLHVRTQQLYGGYPVWGAQAIVHVPHADKQTPLPALVNNKGFATGVLYQQLHQDLPELSVHYRNNVQAKAALNAAIKLFQVTKATPSILNDQRCDLMVYIDENNKAHWIYNVSFHAEPTARPFLPKHPVYLLDAMSFKLYQSWDNVEAVANSHDVLGGGYGGNLRLGKVYYDGLAKRSHRGKLLLLRDDTRQQCFFKNQWLTVLDMDDKHVINYFCPQEEANHNYVYWDGALEAANGGFSASNDVMFAAQMVYEMYQDWYGVPPIKLQEHAAPITLLVHLQEANAYWDGAHKRAYFGDGSSALYPLTTLDVVAHEISHGFTQQHSALQYAGQAGGINEAFSDMAAATLVYYVTKQVNWKIGQGLFKINSRPFRWMNKPSNDGSSIERAQDYRPGMDVHESSGVFNKAFYLLATTPNWDIKKAFAVMLQANQYYWTNASSFQEAACNVVAAARELLYSAVDVVAAFKKVGINTNGC